MKLWEISDEIEKVLASADPETGELSQDQELMLDALDLNLKDKLLACALYLQGEQLEADAVAKMAKQLAARAKRHQARATWLINYMTKHAPQEGTFHIKDPRVEVKWAETERVELESGGDEATESLVAAGLVDLFFVKETRQFKIDKRAVKAALKAGDKPVGLVLRKYRMLRVSPLARKEDDE